MLARVVLVLGGIVVPLVVLEVALHVFGPFLPGNYDTGAYLERDPVLGHTLRRNFDGWIKAPEFTTRITTGPLGLRDPIATHEKPAGTSRIVLLGDSFVQGVGVDDPESVARRLDSRLGASVEVVNGGVAGFGTAQEVLFFERDVARLSPDLVILVFFVGNDITNNNYRLELWNQDLKLALKPYFDLMPDGSLRLYPPPPPPPTGMQEWIRTSSRLFNVVETGVMLKLDPTWAREEHGAVGGIREPVRGIYDTQPEGEWHRGWSITEALLTRLRDRVHGGGGRLAIVGAPELRAMDDDTWRREMGGGRLGSGRLQVSAPTDRLGAVARTLGVPYLDLLQAFRAAHRDGSLFYPLDRHWTARGHAVAAAEIARWIQTEGLLPTR